MYNQMYSMYSKYRISIIDCYLELINHRKLIFHYFRVLMEPTCNKGK